MEHCCLAFIRLIKLHVIICSGADILHIFHIIIDTFDHVMTGRADCYQILALFFGLIKSTYRRKLRSNFVSSQRINTSAALPVFDLFQFKPKCSGAGSRCV